MGTCFTCSVSTKWDDDHNLALSWWVSQVHDPMGCTTRFNQCSLVPPIHASAVKTWKVKVYSLSRESRHRDIVIAQDFFKTLDAFLQAKKSTLAY